MGKAQEIIHHEVGEPALNCWRSRTVRSSSSTFRNESATIRPTSRVEQTQGLHPESHLA